jgi:hypothetical protein
MSSRENYKPGPASGAEVSKDGRTGGSFSSGSCAIRRRRSGKH